MYIITTWLRLDSAARVAADRPVVGAAPEVPAPAAVDSQRGEGDSHCKNKNNVTNPTRKNVPIL